MNEHDFEKQLKADGFNEIEHQKLDPRPGKGRHRHHFEIRGLVISGTFVVRQTGEPVTYRSGEIFSVSEGELHDEWIVASGAHVLVGRKFSNAGAAVNGSVAGEGGVCGAWCRRDQDGSDAGLIAVFKPAVAPGRRRTSSAPWCPAECRVRRCPIARAEGSQEPGSSRSRSLRSGLFWGRQTRRC